MNQKEFIKSRLNCYSSGISALQLSKVALDLAKESKSSDAYISPNWTNFLPIIGKESTNVAGLLMNSVKWNSSDEVSSEWDGVYTELDDTALDKCNRRGDPGQAKHSLQMFDKNGEFIGVCGVAWGADYSNLVKFGKELIKKFGLDPNSIKPKD